MANHIANKAVRPIRKSTKPAVPKVPTVVSKPIATKVSPCPSDESERQKEQHTRKELTEIVDKIFDRLEGKSKISESCCSLPRKCSTVFNYDERVLHWKRYVEDRKLLATRICLETGKSERKVLFNCDTTVNDREKKMVVRIMDYADRMNPTALITKQQSKLKSYVHPCTFKEIPEIRETLPKAERDQCKTLEIIGMPKVTKEEQLSCGIGSGCGKTQWVRSKVLEQRINSKQEDIRRVVEFLPNIEELQVVGVSYDKVNAIARNAEITLLHEEKLADISSETLCGPDIELPELNTAQELPDYGLKINDHIFESNAKVSSKIVDVDICFVSEPFEVLNKQVLCLVNLGKQVLDFQWFTRPFSQQSPKLLKSVDDDFVFDSRHFRLVTGETRFITVQFQPRKVGNVKALWLLRVDPPVFCRRTDVVELQLTGKCEAPTEYVEKLNEVRRTVTVKSSLKAMREFNSNLASAVPMITPNEVLCPYERELNECELFELENPGIKCERFHYIECLKKIYNRVRKPRDESAWNLNLSTLREMILNIERPAFRAVIYNKLTYIVDQMRGEAVSLEKKLDDHAEREHARFLLVQGIIGAGIDDWEDGTQVVEEAFVVPTICQFHEEYGDQMDLVAPEDVLSCAQRHVRYNKALRDRLYVQTYNRLCNIAESIVDVIECADL